jgi:hypothetical protein
MSALKTYTVTVDGTSKGLVIPQPFTIEIHQMSYVAGETENSYLAISSCTKTNSGEPCSNDDIADRIQADMPAMTSSKNADLTAEFESLLDAAYGSGNWS